MNQSATIRLPWPPSVNRYWRIFTPKGPKPMARTILSAEGRAYRARVEALLKNRRVQPLSGRLAVTILAVVPDRRNRDLDNVLKALLDGMQHGGMFLNDGQIDELRIVRGGPKAPGWVDVRVDEIETSLF